MKTFTKIIVFLAGGALLLTSCNDDDPGEWCGVIPSGSAVGSIASDGFRGASSVTLNDSPVNYGVNTVLAFDSISPNSVGALVILEPRIADSPEVGFDNLILKIEAPVAVTGSPYDVMLDYEGDAVLREVEGDTVEEQPLPGISFKGWMKNEYFSAKTRCSIGLTFDCELELIFTLGEDRYVVAIGPHIYWPS